MAGLVEVRMRGGGRMLVEDVEVDILSLVRGRPFAVSFGRGGGFRLFRSNYGVRP